LPELEPAPSWQQGLQQALLYKSLYFQVTELQALPTLILFGDVSARRWGQISTVCVDRRVLLLGYELLVDGARPASDVSGLLDPPFASTPRTGV
jgi:hypothetical protein